MMHRTDFYQLEAYQDYIQKFCIYPDHDKKGIVAYPFFGLVGEIGEIFEKIKKILRDKNGELTTEDVIAIEKEFGDALFYFARCATHLDISLGSVAANNINKLEDRLQRNEIQGSGDNR